ncbi:MAG: ATP-dependent RecD-like DNA helicase [Clostridiales bacterium]|nr:ATP-dependent RecD-like DNA helicase [Clostridiales bacterium]
MEKKELEFGDTVYREGDKIMQTVNNYNKEWYLQGTMRALTAGSGAFNGDIGRIFSIDPAERTLEILFDDDRLAEYSQNELAELEHAYAVTVHKSQGSEFDTVILPLFYGYSEFLTRNLLYTAITRAKRKMILIGSQRTIAHMISNARVSRRFTALDHEIRAQVEMVEKLAQGREGQGDEWDELFRLLEEDRQSGC